jgi:hemolysin activation/secretion protein
MKLSALALLFASFSGAVAALAQTEVLPLQSPAEQQVQQTNRAIQRELQQTQEENQQTLRNDQIQSEIDRLRLQDQPHQTLVPGTRRSW